MRMFLCHAFFLGNNVFQEHALDLTSRDIVILFAM